MNLRDRLNIFKFYKESEQLKKFDIVDLVYIFYTIRIDLF